MNGQNPLSINMGHLVVTKATTIMINGGIDASLVNNPSKISDPQTISNVPVK